MDRSAHQTLQDFIYRLQWFIEIDAKPWVSLTEPNHNHLREFHWQFWIIFLDVIAKAKKLIRKSIAQNLKQVSLKKSF